MRFRLLFPVLVLAGCNDSEGRVERMFDAGADAGPVSAPTFTPVPEVDSGSPAPVEEPAPIGLTDILLSAGKLSPAFREEETRYRVDVPLWVEHVEVTPVTNDPATIVMDGAAFDGTPRSVALALGPNTVELTNSSTGVLYTVEVYRASAIVEELYGKARAPNEGMQLGYAVDVSGDLLVASAPGDATVGKGLDQNETELGAPSSGAVVTFVYGASGWEQDAFLKASNANEEDRFGIAIALSGTTLVVGAPGEDGSSAGVDGRNDDELPGSGAAYVFEKKDGEWKQTTYLKASFPGLGDGFGNAVATDGDRIVVGAYAESNSRGGVDPTTRNDGAPYSGAVYVFDRDGNSWVESAYLKASNPAAGDQFGESVALFENTVVVGAIGERSTATGVDGDETKDDLFTAGAAYVFGESDAGVWDQLAYLKPSNTAAEQRFGSSVAVNADTIAVGAFTEQSASAGIGADGSDVSLPEAGAVYLFANDGVGFEQLEYVKASNPGEYDHFGQRVLLRGDALLVGANLEASAHRGINPPQNDDSASGAGAVYVFFRDAEGAWAERAYLKASNAEIGDNFGFGLGFDGVTLVGGAPYEDNANGGLDMEPSPNNALQSAGAVYVFR